MRSPLLFASLTLLLAPLAGGCANAQHPTGRWTFEQLLSPPTQAELERVDRDWSRKTWTIDGIELSTIKMTPFDGKRL